MTFKVQLIGFDDLKDSLEDKLGSAVSRLGRDLFATVKSKTPVDTGRARAGWRNSMSKDTFTISNNVPYVPILDKGRHMTPRGMRGSKQAPRGIIGPSLTEIKRKN